MTADRHLPRGWSYATIDDITVYVQRGKSPKYTEHSALPVVNQKCIRWHGVDPAHLKFIHPEQWADWGPERFLKDGDILWNSTGTGTIGRAALFHPIAQHPRLVADSHVTIVRTGEYNPQLLHYWIGSQAVQSKIEAMQTGSTNQVELSKDQVLNTTVPVPPLREQRRIVAKIEELTDHSRRAREALDAFPALLDRFRQSVLAAAFRGDLTAEWRDANAGDASGASLATGLLAKHEAAGGHKAGNAAPPTEGVHDLTADLFPEGWQLVTLRDLVQPSRPITYGILKPGPEAVDGVLYVRVADYPNDRLNLASLRKTSQQIDQEFKRSRLTEGDLLLSIRGTVGRIVTIPKDLEGANITQDSARMSIQTSVNRDFVLWYLRSEIAQSRMGRAVKGVAVRGINIGDVRALQVPLPARGEQDAIVRRIEDLLSGLERVRTVFRSASSSLQSLDQSILAKAFRGDLVPQDPNDEPASILLERIRGERAEAFVPKARRGRKPRELVEARG